MYKELYIQSKIIIMIIYQIKSIFALKIVIQQNTLHFLTGKLTHQFKVDLYMHAPTIPFPEVLWYNTRYSSFFPNTVIQKKCMDPLPKAIYTESQSPSNQGFHRHHFTPRPGKLARNP